VQEIIKFFFIKVAALQERQMLQIVYTSIATAEFDPSSLRRLLTECRLRNGSFRLSGHLIYDGRRFIQAFEGPAEAVQATFERIARDPRHGDLVILRNNLVNHRLFGEWSMGFEDSSAASQARRGFVRLNEASVSSTVSADEAVAMLLNSIQTAAVAAGQRDARRAG
jgi:hypothetical protein